MTKTRGCQYWSGKRSLKYTQARRVEVQPKYSRHNVKVTMGLPQWEHNTLSKLSAKEKGRRGGREDNYIGKARSTDQRSSRCRASPTTRPLPKAILIRGPEKEQGLQLRSRAMMIPFPERVRPHHMEKPYGDPLPHTNCSRRG